MYNLIEVPCFVTGRQVVIQGERVVRSSHPRRIVKAGDVWDKSADATLIHWRKVRRFTVAEVIRRCDWHDATVRRQLKRLGLYDVKSVAWRTSWDQYIRDGLTGTQIVKLTGVSHACVSSQMRRLGVEKRVTVWTGEHTKRMNRLLRSGMSKTDVAKTMNVSRWTITNRSNKFKHDA